jgi:hypothetical protein
LVRIKDEEDIGFIPPKKEKPLSGFKTTERVGRSNSPLEVLNPKGGYNSATVSNPEGECQRKKYKPENQFSHLFNAYAQAINKRFGHTGSLFEHPFHRKLIDNERYLQRVVLYIHNNPVHHGFCSHPLEYPWSSYLTCISLKPTKLKREAVIGWFDNRSNFEYLHNEKVEIEKIEKWLELEH